MDPRKNKIQWKVVVSVFYCDYGKCDTATVPDSEKLSDSIAKSHSVTRVAYRPVSCVRTFIKQICSLAATQYTAKRD